jgi:hypothetical protein
VERQERHAEGRPLDGLATPIEVYEAKHYPMDPPDPIDAMRDKRENSHRNQIFVNLQAAGNIEDQ